MKHGRRKLLVIATALAIAAIPATHAYAASFTTQAVVENRQDGEHETDSAFDIFTTADKSVRADNVAYAYSRCSNCRSVAGSVQVVLMTGNPNEVAPTNVAVAVNDQCTSCRTLAAAYQFAMTADGPVNFSDSGEDRIEDIEERFEELVESDAPLRQILAEMDALMNELEQTLKSELAKSGRNGHVDEDRDVDEEDDDD